ncbi:2-dehydro-3-deoxygluconokinase [Zhongshania aliphaticivorans]|uniref:2-dehydro-3-deoxygluconokinase n=1 Tax=Zhongshania aliphaticivorans TaxID=1470434 RepID=A0A5S9NJN6_9GAMM|nr:sugar kinase [Zhongshania aliphaticivorans]CAA0090842.1 2-dehydro-3-deoxygluconokinase [Zhongshania aliphaticivorans]CAA0098341.1 2-dehydro-3-deoxygluconokinase [Zhongshania aliphaticivorans]
MVTASVAVIGECMLEMSLASGGRALSSSTLPASLSFGGDVLNTAVYLSRLGVGVDFVTAVGDDKLSDWLIDQWQLEGVGCQYVSQFSNSSPGLYLISTDDSGERSFSYWRESSPARKLFDDPQRASELYQALSQYPWLYLTGISLAIMSPEARESLFGFIDTYRAAGGKVGFDSNYRPRLWSDVTQTRAIFSQMYKRCDLALLTLDDEEDLFGECTADQHISRLLAEGIVELVLKQGPEGCLVIVDGEELAVPAQSVKPVDTTSAGDSFNAGYLGQRINGGSPEQAAKFAHNLAGIVIQHPGAIVAKEFTAGLNC